MPTPPSRRTVNQPPAPLKKATQASIQHSARHLEPSSRNLDTGIPSPPAGKTWDADWSLEQARDTYGVKRWSNGYFDVDSGGNVVVNAPTEAGVRTVTLMEIIDGLKQRELDTPVMLRLENLVEDRVRRLNQAFRDAITQCEYRSTYHSVFPIKVNQQRHVVDSIMQAGESFGHGLEAGSKAELLIAMASLPSHDCLIVCNGYKDQEFIDLGFQARRLGFECFFVVESLEEVALIIERANHWQVPPMIGVRVKLSTRVEGHWAGDSGDRSLFGLTAVELIAAVDLLRDAGRLDCLQMLHFHLGSQIPSIRNIRDGVKEACRYYVDLHQDGAPLKYLDLGGGLAMDYDGTASTEPHSRNYNLNEYCVDIIEIVMASLDSHGVPHPRLISESGRWTVAPMSVLLFDVLAVTHFEPSPIPGRDGAAATEISQQEHCLPIQNLLYTLDHLSLSQLQESYNDAIYYRDQLRERFSTGEINLRQRAFGENVCLTILNRIAAMIPQLKRVPPALASLCDALSDIYYGNFSVFQSLPDAWAIEQVFPVLPIHRLNERPDRRAIIADLTCDCDGKLDRFTDSNGELSRTLDLHAFDPSQPYYLGVFLVGAYQETLGDLHNLFGDANIASVRVGAGGEIEFAEELAGDSIADVLSYVEYQPPELLGQFRSKAEEGVRTGAITVSQRQEMLTLFQASLRGYTYFER